MKDPTSTLSEVECEELFRALFPGGWEGDDVIAEIAPGGYESSPLLAIFHPSLDQVYRETLQFYRNLRDLPSKRPTQPLPPEPTLEDIAKEYRPTPVETSHEVRELVGQCLWDVFSDNHEVVTADGRVCDLGSFRTTGGFLADFANRRLGEKRYDYIHFYMGTSRVAGRADLTPVFAMIFRRLRRQGLDWTYSFPRMYAMDFRPLKEALDEADGPEWANYNPSQALAQEAEDRERDRQLAELRERLDEGHREAVKAAQEMPPPATVRAYQMIYGRFPQGWPSKV